MKIAKVFLLGLATISMVACNGSGISRKEFVEEAQKLEAASFTKAVVAYEYILKTSGYKENLGVADDNINLKGEMKFTKSDGQFVLDDGQNVPEEVEYFGENLNGNIQEKIKSLPEEGSESAKYYTYFKNPLSIKYSAKTSSSESGSSATTKVSGYMEFEEHGCLVKMTNELSSDYTIKSGSKTAKMSSLSKSSYTITYQ